MIELLYVYKIYLLQETTICRMSQPLCFYISKDVTCVNTHIWNVCIIEYSATNN